MPADIKLLSTSSVQTLKRWAQKSPPKRAVLVQHRTHSKHSPATPTQPHKANHTVPVTANPSTSFRNNNKNHAALATAPGLEVVSLPAEAAKASAGDEPRGSGACCNIPALTALLFSGARVAAPPGHTWLAQPEGSLFSTIQLQSLCMWRGIARARCWGFLAAVAAHPIHCLWCMLSKQSPGSS